MNDDDYERERAEVEEEDERLERLGTFSNLPALQPITLESVADSIRAFRIEMSRRALEIARVPLPRDPRGCSPHDLGVIGMRDIDERTHSPFTGEPLTGLEIDECSLLEVALRDYEVYTEDDQYCFVNRMRIMGEFIEAQFTKLRR